MKNSRFTCFREIWRQIQFVLTPPDQSGVVRPSPLPHKLRPRFYVVLPLFTTTLDVTCHDIRPIVNTLSSSVYLTRALDSIDRDRLITLVRRGLLLSVGLVVEITIPSNKPNLLPDINHVVRSLHVVR